MSGSVRKLRHRVSIQERAPKTQDAFGQEVEGWVEVVSAWADVSGGAGQEVPEANATFSRQDYAVVIRYRDWLTTAHRLVYDGQPFNINAVVDVDERHYWLELACTAGLAKG